MLPNGLDWLGDDPNPPKLGFCPNKDPPPKLLEDVAPNAGAGDVPKAGVELPNGEEDGVPNAGVDGWPKAPVDVAPNAGCWPKAPVDVEPNAGVDCWPKAPVDVAPKAGADCWPKAPVEVAPKAGADGWPKVEVAPKGEVVPVGAPNAGVGLPKGLGAKGLLVVVLGWPKPCWVPKGLVEVCPKGLADDCPNANCSGARYMFSVAP